MLRQKFRSIPINATPYTGQFATGCRLPTLNTAGGTSTQIMSRTRHISRNNVTSIQVAFPNWMIVSNNNGLETGTGGTATITAAIEFNGTSTAFTWSASASVTVADLATSALSDALAVNIPDGAPFFIRCFYTNASGIMYETGAAGTESLDATNGETFRFALSGLTDQTTSTGVPTGGSGSANLRYGPCLLVASITKPSIFIFGTSIGMGFKETALAQASYGGAYGDKGVMARCIGPAYGYTNVAQGGASAVHWMVSANRTLRMQLAAYCSHAICGHGINDLLQTTDTVAVISARFTTMAALFSIPVWLETCTPDSTGAWTLADQTDQTTVTSNGFSTRLAPWNALVRAGVAGFAGIFEIADPAMGTRDSNKWFANGTATFMTPEGLHPSTRGAEYIRSSGAVDATRIRR